MARISKRRKLTERSSRWALFAVLAVGAATSCRAQAVPKDSPPGAEFAVASIKPSISKRLLGSMARDGKFIANGITARGLIAIAYGMRDAEITGGPAWIGSDAFDINAKSDVRVNAEHMRPMIQSLLRDRFKLETHREMKDAPVYVLLAAKGGDRLNRSNDANCTDPNTNSPPPTLPSPGQPYQPANLRCGGFYVLNDHLEGRKVTMQDLVQTLTRMNLLGRPVLNQTGITGTFDIDLQWSEDARAKMSEKSGAGNSSEPVPSADLSGPSIFDAFRETLGLDLKTQRGLVEVVVVDRIDKPTEN